MDTETTSEATEGVSQEVIKNVFDSISSPKPKMLTDFEFQIFYFYHSLVMGTNQITFLSALIYLVFIGQIFFLNCFSLIIEEFDSGQPVSHISQIGYFYIVLKTLNTNNLSFPRYYLSVAFVGFLCAITFFLALYFATKKVHLSIGIKSLIAFFLIDFTIIMLIPMTYITAELLFSFFVDTHNYTQLIFQVCYMIIILIILYVSYHFTTVTIFNSAYYHGGSCIYGTPVLPYNILYFFVAVSIAFNRSILSNHYRENNIFISAVYLLAAIYQFVYGVIRYYPNDFLNSITIGYSCSLFAVIGYNAVRQSNVEYSLTIEQFIYIDLFIFIGLSILSGFIFYISNKYILMNLKPEINKNRNKENEKSIFLSSHRMSNPKLLLYARLGFSKALPTILSLDFVEQVTCFERPRWLILYLYRYANLINPKSEQCQHLISTIMAMPNHNWREKYLLWEMELFQNSSITEYLPEDIKTIVYEIEFKMTRYQTVFRAFTSKVSDDNHVNFLLIDALSTMKKLISNEVCIVKHIFPNCPEVLSLYAKYKEKICDKEKSARAWTALSNDIKKGSISYANYYHLNAFSDYSQLQTVLLRNAKESRMISSQGAHSTMRQFAVNLSTQKLPTIKKKQNDSRLMLSSIFSKRFSVYYYGAIFGFIFFLLAMLVFYLFTFSALNSNQDYYLNLSTILYDTLEVTMHYGNFIIPAHNLICMTDHNTNPDISKEIIQVLELSESFYNSSASFSTSYETIFLSNKKEFKNQFYWVPQKIFEIPTLNYNQSILEELKVVLLRLSNLYDSIVDTNSYSFYFDVPAMPTFIITSEMFPVIFIEIFEYTMDSLYGLLGKLKYDILHQGFLPFLPYFLAIVICVIIPLLMYFEILQLFPIIFPKENSRWAEALFKTFLSKKFSTFEKNLAKFYLLFFFHILTGIGILFSLNSLTSSFHNDVQQYSTYLVNIGHQYIFCVSILSNFYLSSCQKSDLNENYGDFQNNTGLLSNEELIGNLQNSINFFCNISMRNHSILSIFHTQYITEFVMLSIKQISSNNINLNLTALLIMKSLLENQISTQQIFTVNYLIEAIGDETLEYSLNAMTITEIFLALALIFFVFECIIFGNFWKNLNVLIKILTQLPEQRLSSSEKFLERNNLASLSQFKKNSALDLLKDTPCALVETSNETGKTIVTVNHSWLSYFNDTIDNFVGQPISSFIKSDTKYFEQRLKIKNNSRNANIDDLSYESIYEDDYSSMDSEDSSNFTRLSLLIIDEGKISKQNQQKLDALKERVFHLRSIIIPHRFLHEKGPKEFEIPFLINCSIIMSPIEKEDLNCDSFIVDVKEYERSIIEHCKLFDDVDVLCGSARETMLLFGINEKYNQFMLTVSALHLILNIIRIGFESSWGSGGIDICVTISCGNNSKIYIGGDKDDFITMNGEAFSKQMSLKEKLQLNTIICDKEIIKILSDCKFGLDFEQIDNDTYIFSFRVERDVEIAKITSSSSYGVMF